MRGLEINLSIKEAYIILHAVGDRIKSKKEIVNELVEDGGNEIKIMEMEKDIVEELQVKDMIYKSIQQKKGWESREKELKEYISTLEERLDQLSRYQKCSY